MLLCDFFPLYDFQLDICPPPSTGDSQTHEDDNDHSFTKIDINLNKTVSNGLQKRNRASTVEYILAIWVFTLLCEEIRQVT